jgi:hypothetical protein
MNTESSENVTVISERHKETIIAMLRSEGLFFPMIRIEWRKRLGPVAYAAVEQGLKEQRGGPVSDLTDADCVYWETVKLRGVWTGWNENVVTDADRPVFELRDIVPCYLNPAWHPKLAELVGYNIPGKPAVDIPPSENKTKTQEKPAVPKDELLGKVAKEVDYIAMELRQRKKRMSVANKKKNQGMKGGDTKDGRDNTEVMRLIMSKVKDGASLSEICVNMCKKMPNLKVKPASLERSYRRWLISK